MELSEIKQRFFSFRNGIVAKAFHEAADPHPRIFGLQVPQLAAIAREAGFDHDLARALWAEADCRESRLLACWLFDPDTLEKAEALTLAHGIASREEADILAWRLLSRTPYAEALLPQLQGYILEALARNLRAD